MNLSPWPKVAFLGNNGRPLVGGKLFTYEAGTNTKLATYSNESGTLNTNPVVLDFRGEANVWLDPELTYKFVLAPEDDTDPPGNPIWTVDDIAAPVTIATLTRNFLGKILWPRTLGEIAASVTPYDYAYEPGEVIREGPNTSPGGTKMSVPFQYAMDSAFGKYAEVYPRDELVIEYPLLIKSTSQQNLSLIGNGRVSTILEPFSSDIKQSPQNVNALIINQKDNGHLHLSQLRCLDSVAYVGQFLYCKEGGASDGSAQALFSAVIEDCWFSFSSNNTGIFNGGFSNLMVHNNVFESTKTGCFILEGNGNGDQQYIGNVMNGCFDAFLYGAIDTVTKALITVDTLHVYNHLRGPIFELNNVIGLKIAHVFLEAAPVNFGSIGLLKIKDCIDVDVSDCTMSIENSAPRGAVGIDIINSNSGTFRGLTITADVGIRVQGTGTIDLTFVDCDFIGCQYAYQYLSGTISGRLRFINCRLNNNEYGMLHSTGTPSMDIDFIDGEVMNSGITGVATNRNINVSTSGNVYFNNTKIGQDDVNAVADYYFRIDGAGAFVVSYPRLTGTPPVGLLDPSSTQPITYDGVNSGMPGMPAFVPSVGGTATYTLQDAQWSLQNGRVSFSGRLVINTIGTGSQTTVSGLPFTSNATYYGAGTVPYFQTLAANITTLGFTVAPGGTSFILRSLLAAAPGTGNNNVLQNASDIIFEGSYPLP